MQNRIKIVSILVLLIVSLGVSGTARSAGRVCGGDPVSLTFVNVWGAQREPLMNQVIENFKKVCPNITVVNSVIPSDGRAELVASAVASSNPPGLIMTLRVETYQFAQKGLIIPITSYVKEAGLDVDKIFYAGEIANQYYNGDLWTLPMPTAGGLTGFYFYNKSLLKTAGLDPNAPPKTWQELETMAKAVTQKDAMGIETLGTSLFNSTPDAQSFAAWLYTNNGRLFSDDGRKVTFNNAEGVQTLEWMVKFTNEINGGVEATTDFWKGLAEASADFPFFTEKFAVHFANVSFFGHLKTYNPDMWNDTGRWGIELHPYNADNPKAAAAGVSGLSFAWGYTIPAHAPKNVQDAAFEFLKFLGTDKDGGCYFLLAQGRPSPVKSCNENKAYYEANPYWDKVLEALAIDVSVPITPAQTKINDLLTAAIQKAMFGSDAKTVLDSAAAEAQKLLDDYWATAGTK